MIFSTLANINYYDRSSAWVGEVVSANDAHPVVECSNKGICDRKTGECECFANYEGIACERTVCPNSCSDAGASRRQLALGFAPPLGTPRSIGCV